MTPSSNASLFAVAILLGMIVLLEAGRRLANRRLARDPEGAQQGLGVVEGAVFSLLGLLIAFTFSGAAGRFDDRRRMIVDEANCMGTAWLRVDLMPERAQPELRGLFRQYVDARLDTYRRLPDIEAAKAGVARSGELQRAIWANAVAACRESGSQPAHILLLPALNEMFDIMTTRIEAMNIHPPQIIFLMLGVLSLAASLFAGYGMAANKTRSWLHIVGFAAVMSLTVYVIVDIEYPRFGLITLEGSDRVLQELRDSMK